MSTTKLLRAFGTQQTLKKHLLFNNNGLVRFSCSKSQEDIVTHTGQKWDADDYRMVRFVNREKLVNPNWAVDLINEVAPIECKDRVVWCDGGSGPTGHPKVYINLDKPGPQSCGYCGLRFCLAKH